MADRPQRFETPEQARAYMKTVAVGQSGFSRWLDVDPGGSGRASPNLLSPYATR